MGHVWAMPKPCMGPGLNPICVSYAPYRDRTWINDEPCRGCLGTSQVQLLSVMRAMCEPCVHLQCTMIATANGEHLNVLDEL